MTIEKLNEVTQNLTTLFGKGDCVTSETYGWYYKDFAIYTGVSLDSEKGVYIPYLSMYYEPDSEKFEEEWTDQEWLSTLDFKEFIDSYKPRPINCRKVTININLEVPDGVNLDIMPIEEAIRRYKVEK